MRRGQPKAKAVFANLLIYINIYQMPLLGTRILREYFAASSQLPQYRQRSKSKNQILPAITES